MSDKILTQNQIAESLKPVFNIYNINKAVLFGSYAKNTANVKSDVDLYVDSNLKGMKFVGLMESIRKALGGKDVDVIDESHIDRNSQISREIDQTGVLIYERR